MLNNLATFIQSLAQKDLPNIYEIGFQIASVLFYYKYYELESIGYDIKQNQVH